MTIGVVLPVVNATRDLRQGIELVKQDFNSFNIEINYREIAYPDAAEQAKCLRAFREEGVAGVVVSPMESPVVLEELRALHAAHILVVTMHSDLEDAPCLCFVGQDMEQAGQVAARLVRLFIGTQGKIGVLSSWNQLRSVEQRERAFSTYLTQKYPDIQIVMTVDTQESPQIAYDRTRALLQEHEDLQALFITCGCVSDICRAVRDAGRAGSLTVICYERYPEIDAVMCTTADPYHEQYVLASIAAGKYVFCEKTAGTQG